MSTERLAGLTRRASELVETQLACCCVLVSARPAFLLHAERPSDRRSWLARSLTEMVLQVARPRAESGRQVVARAPLFTVGRLLVMPVVEEGMLVGAVGVAAARPRPWTPADLRKLGGIAEELSRLGGARSGIVRAGRARASASSGTSRRGARQKTS